MYKFWHKLHINNAFKLYYYILKCNLFLSHLITHAYTRTYTYIRILVECLPPKNFHLLITAQTYG